MRYLIVTIMYLLLANPVLVSAQNDGAPPAELTIVGKKEGKDFHFEMGESLKIEATGNIVSSISDELKPSGSKALTLYLDGVRMVGLAVSASETEAGKKLLLSFHLARNSQDNDNRKAWDTLLAKQDGYLMKLPVTLAVGNKLPLPVQSTSPFQFYIAQECVIWLTVGIGTLIFLFGYCLLIINKAALRDEKDGFYSLGKSQMAFWGLLALLTFVGVWLVTGTMERLPPQVLILLGISGATGLGAKVIGESKKVSKRSEILNAITKLQEEQQKLETEQLMTPNAFPQASKNRLPEINSEIEKLKEQPSSIKSVGFWQDICDDGNGLSFHRLQVVIWTMVLGVIFVWSVVQGMSMPEFSETLLILLGISNGTYLGFKIPEK